MPLCHAALFPMDIHREHDALGLIPASAMGLTYVVTSNSGPLEHKAAPPGPCRNLWQIVTMSNVRGASGLRRHWLVCNQPPRDFFVPCIVLFHHHHHNASFDHSSSSYKYSKAALCSPFPLGNSQIDHVFCILPPHSRCARFPTR